MRGERLGRPARRTYDPMMAWAAPEPSVIQRRVLRLARALGLPAGARILDAPCGEGALAAALAADGFEAWGTDVDPGARAVLGDRFVRADLGGPLPWPDGSFDLVACVEGIEHLENGYSFLREVHRVLRAGGLLIVTTPNTVSLRSRVRFFGSGFYHRDALPLTESGRHPMHHIGLRTFPELRYALHTSGLRLVQVGHTHVKPVSYLYSPLAPWMWLYTLIAFRREKDGPQRGHNRAILGALFSGSLLWGENLLLVARKAPHLPHPEPAASRTPAVV
jgi:SAM-dependent methyltransferase